MEHLFELPDPRKGSADFTHVLMPCMAYACGETILTTRGHFTVGPRPWDQVTCPECRAFGAEYLTTECQRQQGTQRGEVR